MRSKQRVCLVRQAVPYRARDAGMLFQRVLEAVRALEIQPVIGRSALPDVLRQLDEIAVAACPAHRIVKGLIRELIASNVVFGRALAANREGMIDGIEIAFEA